MSIQPKRMLFALLVLLASTQALAHAQEGLAGGFVTGFLHPILGPDHMLAMIAVGLWGAQLGAPLLWVLPIAFPAMMAFGALLGTLAVPLPFVEVGIAVSALILGLAVLLQWRAPSTIAVALVAGFALFHGHAHGTELPNALNPLAYGFGFVVSTGLLHLAGITLGSLNHLAGGRFAIRGAGGAIAVAGALFLVGMF